MSPSYGTAAPSRLQGWWVALGRAAPLAVPAAVVVGVVAGAAHARGEVLAARSVVLVALTGLAASVARRTATGLLLAVLVVVGAWASSRAWDALLTVETGPYAGPARVLADPVSPNDESTIVTTVLEVGGERYEVWAGGSAGRRLARTVLGDVVTVDGERHPLDRRPAWLVARHVVGELSVRRVDEVRPGAPAFVAANRVRRQMEIGARLLRPTDAALVAGLVYGDDRALPDRVVDRFRGAGLSHLTAVSGQNVAYLLAAASPVLRRLSPGGRWTATVTLIAWFALLTRFEPSVLRASMMAALSATAFVTGRDRSAIGLLAVALTILLVCDPLLAWSVGLWLSAGATAGLALLGPPLERAMPGPAPIASGAAAALAAQLGVMPVSLVVFGMPSVLSLPANVLAVPVAGAVMLVGFPLGIMASVLPDSLAGMVQLPCVLGARWVAGVASVADALRLPTVANAGAWAGVVCAVAVRLHRVRATLGETKTGVTSAG